LEITKEEKIVMRRIMNNWNKILILRRKVVKNNLKNKRKRTKLINQWINSWKRLRKILRNNL
jgi:hypothetical protein